MRSGEVEEVEEGGKKGCLIKEWRSGCPGDIAAVIMIGSADKTCDTVETFKTVGSAKKTETVGKTVDVPESVHTWRLTNCRPHKNNALCDRRQTISKNDENH